MGVRSLSVLLYPVINYKFKDEKLLNEALTHPSALSAGNPNDNIRTYERLEFLGDSVLNMIITDILYRMFLDENELSKRRIDLVCGKTIAKVGQRLNLHSFIKRDLKNLTAYSKAGLENATEALIGAIYIDGGFENTKQFIMREWSEMINTVTFNDYKSQLNDCAQKYQLDLPEYKLLNKSGPQNKLRFTVLASLDQYGTSCGTASSIKGAEQIAAKELLKRIEGTNDKKSASV